MSTCTISPISGFQSTNLNNRIDTFNRLGDRILRSLGYPTINVEVHRDQLFENISIATEYFTKFAGYTREYLIFDSNLYVKNYGIKLDHLFTFDPGSDDSIINVNKDFTKEINLSADQSFICLSAIPQTFFDSVSSLSGVITNGIEVGEVISGAVYDQLINYETSDEVNSIGESIIGFTFEVGQAGTSILSGMFQPQVPHDFTVAGSVSGTPTRVGIDQNPPDIYNRSSYKFINSFDYDVMDYRKVIDVRNFTEGSTTGINTLFTIEQTLAQQTYFSYAMGNYGFDLVSWYTLKNWLETREKLVAIERTYSFDPRTQLLRMYPQPGSSNDNVRFYGVIDCYVERPIRDVIKELWVYQYSLALTKILVGRIRGKYAGTNLFGGGALNADILSEGLTEKAQLEELLYTGAPGQGDADPPLFFVG